MGWSWRIGRIAGIDIYLHFTFILLLVWIGLGHFLADGDIAKALSGLVLIVALFSIIVLHELGHALAARRYGIATRDITLLPIGGVARLERMPEDPKQELVVALAGPAVNVVLALGIFVVLMLGRGLAPMTSVFRVGGDILQQLFAVNVMLVVFNLLPAFPMDGGRVLRALLAMRLDYVRATQVAASIGQGMALLFGFLGLLSFWGFPFSPFLLFIALFVWMGAAQEASMVQMRSALDGIPVRNAMITDFRTLRPDDPLGKAIDYIVAGFQQDFPVVEDEQPVGVLKMRDLAAALGQYGRDIAVGQVMQRQFATAHPGDMLNTALARLQEGDTRVLPVVQNGRLVGLLTADNLAEVLMIQDALARSRRSPSAGHSSAPGSAAAYGFPRREAVKE